MFSIQRNYKIFAARKISYILYIFIVLNLMSSLCCCSSVQAESINSIDTGKLEKSDQSKKCSDAILQRLQAVVDPEYDISIVDLGLVSSVDCDAVARVNTIEIILTSSRCPFIKDMVEDIKSVSRSLYPRRAARVVVDMETHWRPSFMTKRGKELFWGKTQ